MEREGVCAFKLWKSFKGQDKHIVLDTEQDSRLEEKGTEAGFHLGPAWLRH